MKEIPKVDQKLSREQESAAGGGGGTGQRTNRYKNIKSPPVYWGDLITVIETDIHLLEMSFKVMDGIE